MKFKVLTMAISSLMFASASYAVVPAKKTTTAKPSAAVTEACTKRVEGVIEGADPAAAPYLTKAKAAMITQCTKELKAAAAGNPIDGAAFVPADGSNPDMEKVVEDAQNGSGGSCPVCPVCSKAAAAAKATPAAKTKAVTKATPAPAAETLASKQEKYVAALKTSGKLPNEFVFDQGAQTISDPATGENYAIADLKAQGHPNWVDYPDS